MKTPAEWKTLFESSAFARQTNYSGPLGPEYNPSGTRLRLWAPTAQKVSVNLYRRGDGGACMGTLPLEQHGQGVWSVYLPGDQHGHYYTFTVEVDGTAYETGDPYARTAGVNGLRSMILDAPRIDPPDWNHDHRVIVPASRRTVWEVSVRDFSQDPACGVRNAWRGKFMAFTQKGTTLSSAGTFPTCLDYLKRLGVGYVQLMPIFDFGSVDESRPLTRQYNWGYDPTNYNVPEGSYSTDPTKGEVRVRECKEMIAALHAAGIGVIMDVVYNHMYRSENPLNRTVPYYFFRQNPDGSFSNGSGCGNEFASERPMARKYLIDSVLYWAQEYHIDGFRFDLMGLYDVDTMNELRAALDALPCGRNILMYGEPWQGGGSQLHRYEANKANLAMLSERIGVFCDNTRDVIKGGCFDAREPGYVEGRPGSFWDIGGAVAAWCRSDKLPAHSPSQIVSYVSAHDNFTLWDKLMLVRYARPEYTAADSAALAQNRLAAGIYLTCMGMPFMQAGEEFARTKKGQGKPGSFWDIGGAVAAWCRSDKLPAHSPSQIVSYVSAHDNFTLWDKLMLVRYARPEYTAADSAALAQNRLAAGIYLTCMGMPFLQAGEEFARTKKGQGNTYHSSPSLNRLDWKRAAQFHGLVDYYRGLLGLRAQFPRLSASDTASPAAIKFFSLEQPLVGWTLPAAPGDGAAWRALCVFYNPTEEEKRVRLPDGQWKLLSDGVSSALWKGPSRVCGGEVTLLPYSATIFGQV